MKDLVRVGLRGYLEQTNFKDFVNKRCKMQITETSLHSLEDQVGSSTPQWAQ